MANHFRETAESLRRIADKTAAPNADERADIRHAADILCRLEQLKRDLISTAGDADSSTDTLVSELISLLGVHRGS